MSQEKENESKQEPEGGGPPRVSLKIQTPRGLWSTTEPANAAKRPIYPISTKIGQVITDAREVFKFTETGNQYVLLHGQTKLESERTIASYHLIDGTLLVLSVQGGNAQ
jgi:hypothetical protein